jgi:hypothetical protein
MTNDWMSRGKSVSQLIEELKSFDDRSLEVRVSIDGGRTSYPISLVGKSDGRYAVLKNSETVPTAITHGS